MGQFNSSYLKIERANKHILSLNEILGTFLKSGFYSVLVDKDLNELNYLRIDFNPSDFPGEEAALVIGDALHNLRSALDLLYFQVISDGTETKYTRFPVRDTRDELIAPLNGALINCQISKMIHDFILDTIKPYKAGNPAIWTLDDLNIRDKHKLLIPLVKAIFFIGISLEDDKGIPVPVAGKFMTDVPILQRINDLDGWPIEGNITVKDKGHATANIFFDLGTPFEGCAIMPTLNRITEEVTRTIKAFELLLGDGRNG
jgi:hypothetical protein